MTESCVLYLALLNCLIPAMGTLLNGAAHVSFKLQKKFKKIWSTQCGSDVASKNKSITSKSVSFTRLLKNERNMWAIKSSGDNGMSISVSIFICPFFVLFFFACGEAPYRPLCNTSTISKAIKRCSNSRTLKGFIRAVLSTRHLPGRLAVARVTLTNGDWRQEGRRNTRESWSCYA